MVKELYSQALGQIATLTEPYASVIDIDPATLPSRDIAQAWSGERWANTLRHVPGHPEFHPGVRQLMHVGFKLAAKQGSKYTDLLKANSVIIAKNVFDNLYERHMKPLFLS